MLQKQTKFQAQLLAYVAANPGQTDRQVTAGLFGRAVHPSKVNQEARLLSWRGQVFRQLRLDGRIGNYPVSQEANRLVSRLTKE